MSTSVAQDLIQSYFRRWQNLEADKKAISDDLKELFVEARAHGFDGKALRAAFRKVENAEKADVQEHEAIVDLYVTALTGTEVAIARSARSTETGREVGHPVTDRAGHANDAEDPAREPEDRNTGGEYVDGGTSVRPAGQETGAQPSGIEEGIDIEPTSGPDAKRAPIPQSESLHVGSSCRSLDTGSDETSDDAAGAGASAASIVQFHQEETREERALRLRPHCQHPSACRSSEAMKHCYSCKKSITSMTPEDAA